MYLLFPISIPTTNSTSLLRTSYCPSLFSPQTPPAYDVPAVFHPLSHHKLHQPTMYLLFPILIPTTNTASPPCTSYFLSPFPPQTSFPISIPTTNCSNLPHTSYRPSPFPPQTPPVYHIPPIYHPYSHHKPLISHLHSHHKLHQSTTYLLFSIPIPTSLPCASYCPSLFPPQTPPAYHVPLISHPYSHHKPLISHPHFHHKLHQSTTYLLFSIPIPTSLPCTTNFPSLFPPQIPPAYHAPPISHPYSHHKPLISHLHFHHNSASLPRTSYCPSPFPP